MCCCRLCAVCVCCARVFVCLLNVCVPCVQCVVRLFLLSKCVCLVRALLRGAVWFAMCCVSVFVDVCVCAFG